MALRRVCDSRLLFLPAVVYLLVFFFLPLGFLLIQSLLAPDNYLRIFRESVYVAVLLNTAKMALAVTLVCVLLGYPFAYFMTRLSEKAVNLTLALVILPYWTSILVRTYAWLVLLQRDGLVNKLLLHFGLIHRPLKLVYNLTGVVCGITYIMLPYMILILYSCMRSIDPQIVTMARSLGASTMRALLKVFVPLTSTGIVAGSSLVFILSLGYFITPALLGGSKEITFSMVIDTQMNQLLDWRFGSALSVFLLLIVVVVLLLVRRVVQVERSVQWIQ